MTTEMTREPSDPKAETAHRFNGDRKNLDHFLLSIEKKIIVALLPRVPLWLGTVELTLMTLLWSAGVIVFGYFAAQDIRWLWAFSACILLQHITDMLDGAVGRARNTGLIKWGFYADHFLDYVFMCSIVIGYSFLLPDHYHLLVLLCLFFSGGLMVHTFLDFGITNDYKISYFRIGISELRCFVVAINIAGIFLGKDMFVGAFPFVVAGLFLSLSVIVYRSQISYRMMDQTNRLLTNR